jgi:hypothetical protein
VHVSYVFPCLDLSLYLPLHVDDEIVGPVSKCDPVLAVSQTCGL